jgi:hypothetical protein
MLWITFKCIRNFKSKWFKCVRKCVRYKPSSSGAQAVFTWHAYHTLPTSRCWPFSVPIDIQCTSYVGDKTARALVFSALKHSDVTFEIFFFFFFAHSVFVFSMLLIIKSIIFRNGIKWLVSITETNVFLLGTNRISKYKVQKVQPKYVTWYSVQFGLQRAFAESDSPRPRFLGCVCSTPSWSALPCFISRGHPYLQTTPP